MTPFSQHLLAFHPAAWITRSVLSWHRSPGKWLALALTLGTIATSLRAQDLVPLDAGFLPNVVRATSGGGFPGIINALTVQQDGKMLIGGSFDRVNGSVVSNLARLNADGSLDASFNATIKGPVYALATQTDGKLLVGGSFSEANGVARVGLVRFDADGGLDARFSPTLEVRAGSRPEVYALAVQADGEVLAGGLFLKVNGEAHANVARFREDGSLDRKFRAQANGDVCALAVQADGRVLLGGRFTGVNGAARAFVARVEVGGALDGGFDAQVSDGYDGVHAVAVQADGKVLFGGSFGQVHGLTRGGLARVNADGSLDVSFGAYTAGNHFGNIVYALAVQTDGKILLGGLFTQVNGSARDGFARLGADGSLDGSLDLRIPDSEIAALAVGPDGQAILAGTFAQINGMPRTSLARINLTAPAPPAATVVVYTTTTGLLRSTGQEAIVTFSRSAGDLSRALRVSYTLSGLANGTDYALLAGTKEIEAGLRGAQIQIKPLPNGASGKLKLTVIPGDGYAVGVPGKIKIKIAD